MVTEKITYAAAGGTVAASAFSLQEWGIIVGIAVSVLTYLTHLVFSLRKDRREERAMKQNTQVFTGFSK